MTRVLNVGIVGCGGIANNKHFPAQKRLQEMGKVRMVAFCDLIPERAQKACAQYGVEGAKVYTDYHDLIAREDIDQVLVLTENVGHAPISIAAMKAGKHVMCEKPMAKTYADACEMLRVSKETGMKLTIGYQSRFIKENLFAKLICDRGDLGEIYYAHSCYLRRRGVPTWGVFTDKEKQGGGPLIDIATHALDRSLWMMNNYEPDRVLGVAFQKLNYANSANSSGPWDPKEFNVEDSAFAFIKMKNGATINLECSWALNIREPKQTMEFYGTKAGLDFADGVWLNFDKDQTLHNDKLEPTKYNIPLCKGQDVWDRYLEAETFYDAIVNDTSPVVLPEQALVVSQILEGIYISAETGKEFVF